MLAATARAPCPPAGPDFPGVAGIVLYHAGKLLQVTGAELLLICLPVQCESDGLFRFVCRWAHVTCQCHHLHFVPSSLLLNTIHASPLAISHSSQLGTAAHPPRFRDEGHIAMGEGHQRNTAHSSVTGGEIGLA